VKNFERKREQREKWKKYERYDLINKISEFFVFRKSFVNFYLKFAAVQFVAIRKTGAAFN